MSRKTVRTVVLTTTADFFTGMATAWAFAAVDALHRLAWGDLQNSLFLATLSFSLSIGIKLKLYVKHSRSD